ncbi:unnamed protein product [Cyclocybe aegerita]|uniref:F-box domain-containing protein n=1 Tax=Cyclocybe aegerita TaxID=1973307 RepID=A0A8S0XMY7_CYCAE|nr:unnamed protein product [Cyclocybe aegerita]
MFQVSKFSLTRSILVILPFALKLVHSKVHADSMQNFIENVFSGRRATDKQGNPFSHLLTSNAPPSHEEATQIREFIIILEENVALLEGQFDEESNKTRANLSKTISEYRAVLSPIRTLPPEILEKILLEDRDYPFPQRQVHYPWGLSHVCRFWRGVVISSPHFWNIIALDLSFKPKRMRSFETCMDVVLERSRNVGLYVAIYGSHDDDDNPSRLLSILASHSERWANLFIMSGPETLMKLSSVKGRLSLLSRIGITFLSIFGTQGKYDLDMFAVAPKLRYALVAGSLGPHLDTLHLPLPWSHLRAYEDHIGNRADQESLIYSLSPRIEILKLCQHRPTTRDDALHFNRLQRLTITFMHNNNTHDGFFERLTLPSLREASFKGRIGNFTPRFTALISRSSTSSPCYLTVLSFRGTTSFQPGELTRLLLHTSRLQKLTTPLPPTYDILELAKTRRHDSITPKLRELHISVDDLLSEDYRDPIRQLASARCGFMRQNTTDFKQHRDVPKDIRRVDSLVFSFTSEVATRLGYSVLQEDFPQERLDEKIVKTMTAWKVQIWDSIPWLKGRPAPRTSFLTGSRLKKLDQLFSTIEGYEVPSSAYLRASSMHFLMYILCHQTKDGDIPGDGRYHFRTRASTILQNWKPLLLKDLPHYLWRIKGRTLIYTPWHDDIRSKAAGMELIYGGGQQRTGRLAYTSLTYLTNPTFGPYSVLLLPRKSKGQGRRKRLKQEPRSSPTKTRSLKNISREPPCLRMLSSRPIQLNTDATYFPTKTPGRAGKNRAENAHAGIGVPPTIGKGKNVPKTPFQSQSRLKDGKIILNTVSRPLGDKTPLPNRLATTLFQTPLPQKSKLSQVSVVGGGGEQNDDGEGNTPESGQRPSSMRKHIKHPRLSGKNFQTPMNRGNHWEISDDEGIVLDTQPMQETIVEDEDDFDEVEYGPPNTLDLPYQPPFDFELPDYKEVGKALRQLAFSVPCDDIPAFPEPEIPVSELEIQTWDLIPLPALESDDPFDLARLEASNTSMVTTPAAAAQTSRRFAPTKIANAAVSKARPQSSLARLGTATKPTFGRPDTRAAPSAPRAARPLTTIAKTPFGKVPSRATPAGSTSTTATSSSKPRSGSVAKKPLAPAPASKVPHDWLFARIRPWLWALAV